MGIGRVSLLLAASPNLQGICTVSQPGVHHGAALTDLIKGTQITDRARNLTYYWLSCKPMPLDDKK